MMKKYFNNKKVMIKITCMLLLLAVFNSSCKKLVEIEVPTTSITGLNVYANDATAAAVLTGVYTSLGLLAGRASIGFQTGLSSDELTLYSGSFSQDQIFLYKNALQATEPPIFWQGVFSMMLPVNAAINGISSSKTLTPKVKDQLLGEAKFLRAFFHFYLVNLYGDVPLVITSDWRETQYIQRTSKENVYRQIIQDLKEAQILLSDNYFESDAKTLTDGRLRPNKWTACALLARAYLYTNQYDSAEAQATLIINNKSSYDTIALNDVFLKNSKEAIWQLQPIDKGWNTEDARVYLLTSSGPDGNSQPVYLSSFLLNVFETSDKRKTTWVDSVVVGNISYPFPKKYKIATENADVTEYQMVLRLAEQYLIRAEARAHLNKVSESQSDLNVIRTRAGLANTTSSTQPTLLTAILHERQVELFTEWGHRWFDLKRTNNIDAVMNVVTPQKGGTWNLNWQWYPVPQSQVINFGLVQNSGY